MSISLTNRDHQLILRELLFVGLALIFVSVPAFASVGIAAWAFLGCLLAIAAVHPRALILTVPAAIGLSFRPVDLGALQFNMLEIIVFAALVGYVPRILLSTRHVRGLATEQRHQLMRRLVPDRLAAGTAILLVIGGAISILWMADADAAAESLRTVRWTIAVPVAYFFLAAPVLAQRDMYRCLAGALFLSGALISAIIALMDGITGGGIQADAVTRLSGIAPHPNALALVLDRAFVLGVLAGVLFRKRVSGPWIYSSAVVGVVTILTFSRGAAIGIVAGVLLVLVVARARRYVTAAFGFAVTSVAAMIAVAPERTLSLLGGGSGSLRLELWESSIRMIADHPVTGVGPDQFLYQYLPRYVTPESWPERFTSHPHNLILDAWLSLGIIGMVVLGLLAVVVVRNARIALATKDRISLAASGALVTAAVHGMVDQSYFLPELAMSVWLLICLVVGSPQLERRDEALLPDNKLGSEA